MRYRVRFERTIGKYAVVDGVAADQTIGLHGDFDAAFSHAEAEEELWRRYGSARQAADMYERQRTVRWVA